MTLMHLTLVQSWGFFSLKMSLFGCYVARAFSCACGFDLIIFRPYLGIKSPALFQGESLQDRVLLVIIIIYYYLYHQWCHHYYYYYYHYHYHYHYHCHCHYHYYYYYFFIIIIIILHIVRLSVFVCKEAFPLL